MSANRSAAVMQRRSEPHDSLDDFPTPPWATRALLRFLREQGEPLHLQRAWEPACNRLYMARVLAEEFDRVHATDVHDYGAGQDGVADFLLPWAAGAPEADWIVTNPPFRLAAQFIQRAMCHVRRGVAVLVRNAFVEGVGRYEALFRDNPEAFVLPFVERVVMWKGLLLDPDVPIWRADPRTGVGRFERPSSATAYQWLVWRRGADVGWERDTRLHRIAPCRLELTRPGDYPPLPPHLLPPDGGLV